MRNTFSKDYYFQRGVTACQTALANNTAYPASGSYIDVSAYEWVNVVIQLGGIADAVVFALKQTDATNGATLDTIDATNCKKTIATADDGQLISMYLETALLADDHHFITAYVSSVTGNNYATITYFLGGTRHRPVTQATALCPSDNQFIHAG